MVVVSFHRGFLNCASRSLYVVKIVPGGFEGVPGHLRSFQSFRGLVSEAFQRCPGGCSRGFRGCFREFGYVSEVSKGLHQRSMKFQGRFREVRDVTGRFRVFLRF